MASPPIPKGELLLQFQHPNGQAPPVTRVRSTLLTASLQTLRAIDLEATYLRGLPSNLHPEIQGLVPGTWVPLNLAMAHYRACDSMNRSPTEIAQMGEAVALRTQKSFLSTIGKVATGVGVTPWVFFENHHRIWNRIFDGGDQCVYRRGPKDAVSHVVQNPLLEIPYFRNALRNYYQAAVRVFARTVTAREVPQYASASSTAVCFSWV